MPPRLPPRSPSVLVVALVLAACGGGGEEAPIPGDPSAFTSGVYAVSAPTGRSDACSLLPEDLELLGNPTVVLVQGGVVEFQAPAFAVVPAAAPTIAGQVNGTSFDGARSDVFDIAAMFPGAPYDCQLRVNREIAGTIGVAGRAYATDSVAVRVEGGTQCDVAWADYQRLRGATGSLPCSSTVSFDLQRTGDVPLPPVYRLDAAQGSGSILTDANSLDPLLGTGALSGVFDDVPFDAAGDSACAYYAPEDVYLLAARSAEFMVQASIAARAWTPGTKTIDGAIVVVGVVRLSDGMQTYAEPGTLVLNSAPTALDDPGSLCSFSISGPLTLTAP